MLCHLQIQKIQNVHYLCYLQISNICYLNLWLTESEFYICSYKGKRDAIRLDKNSVPSKIHIVYLRKKNRGGPKADICGTPHEKSVKLEK